MTSILRFIVLVTIVLIGRVEVQSATSPDSTILASTPYIRPATPCEPCVTARRSWLAEPVQQFVTTINGCTFTLSARVRSCPGTGCLEYKIEKVTSAPNPCPSVNPEDMANLVMGHLIVTNQIGLNLSQHGSSACIVIIRPACWRMTMVPSGPCGQTPPQSSGGMQIFPVVYQPGEMQPCTPDECCINTEMVQVTNCGNLTIYGRSSSMSASEYSRFFRVAGYIGRNEYEQAILDNARLEFDQQFLRTTCRDCPPGGLGEQGGSNPPPPVTPCQRSCTELFILEYYRLMNEGVLKKYGADE